MKRILTILVLTCFITSCNKEKTGSMTVSGNIDGLKKGTLYLQKIIDTLVVAIDSVQLNGSPEFVLVDEIESPEIYYLQLDDNTDKIISFFGEKGEITINSKLDKFVYSAKVSGSENHILMEEHNEMLSQFNGRHLELIKEKFEAQKVNDTAKLSDIDSEEKSLQRRQFYYTVNYAVNNSSKEIAPFLALTELNYASIKILDTVNNALTKNVKSSKYGVELQKFIDRVKASESKKE